MGIGAGGKNALYDAVKQTNIEVFCLSNMHPNPIDVEEFLNRNRLIDPAFLYLLLSCRRKRSILPIELDLLIYYDFLPYVPVATEVVNNVAVDAQYVHVHDIEDTMQDLTPVASNNKNLCQAFCKEHPFFTLAFILTFIGGIILLTLLTLSFIDNKFEMGWFNSYENSMISPAI